MNQSCRMVFGFSLHIRSSLQSSDSSPGVTRCRRFKCYGQYGSVIIGNDLRCRQWGSSSVIFSNMDGQHMWGGCRWCGAGCRRCTTCAVWEYINRYQNYETRNGTYGMPEIFTFAVDTPHEPMGVTGLWIWSVHFLLQLGMQTLGIPAQKAAEEAAACQWMKMSL